MAKMVPVRRQHHNRELTVANAHREDAISRRTLLRLSEPVSSSFLTRTHAT